MKKLVYLLFTFLFTFQIANASNDVYLFHSSTCSHCQAEIEYLNSVKEKYDLTLHLYEVDSDEENYEFMQKVKTSQNISEPYTPFTIVGDVYYIGFEDSVKSALDKELQKEHTNDVMKKIINNESLEVELKKGIIDEIHIGNLNINPNEASLGFLAVVIGFIDGFNPCAMWVLLFLISMLLGMKDRKKMWIIGLTFLVSSALVYLAFMLAWLKVATSLTGITWVRIIIALIALIGGLINLTSYFKERKQDNGCQVVDDEKRKSIIKRIRKIIEESNTSFILALLGVIGLAVSVNLIELACSSGLPLIFTQVLALNDLTKLQYFIYIFIYILFFLIDDIVIFVIAMTTLKVTGISTKYNKLSHLIGGILMLVIGLLMMFAPKILMFNF